VEIVLEKLAASLGSGLGLIACAAPVAYVVSWLGGIAPEDLLWAFAIAASVGALGCALALGFSVWARSAHEALLGVYAVWAIVLVIYRACVGLSVGAAAPLTPAVWAELMNPFWLSFACYLAPGVAGPADYLRFLAVTLGASAALFILSVVRLRRTTVALTGG